MIDKVLTGMCSYALLIFIVGIITKVFPPVAVFIPAALLFLAVFLIWINWWIEQ